MNLNDKLDLWITNEWNVLFEGSHGIGKTAIINKAFTKSSLQWQYFSAPTMDPWVDLVGVPKERTDEKTGMSYLDLIRPRAFEEDSVEAIFIDEFNRAQRKTTNAIMELLQFKSINGRRFHNLKFIWAAINPETEDGKYHVESLDPATEDRFMVQYKLPSEPNLAFFTNKYGQHIGKRAVDWWHSTLPDHAKELVSPRRLEYAVDAFQIGADLNDVLKPETRPDSLHKRLAKLSIITEHSERWLQDPDVYIKEVSNRKSDIDTVEAISELVDISMDMAVEYVGKLPSPMLSKLATNDTTLGVLLRAYSNMKSSRILLTAITSNVVADHPTEDMMAEMRLTYLSAQDTTLFAKTSAARADTTEYSTNGLLAELIVRMDKSSLEFDDCKMLLNICGKKNHMTHIVTHITKYVMETYPDRLVEYVSIHSSVVCKFL